MFASGFTISTVSTKLLHSPVCVQVSYYCTKLLHLSVFKWVYYFHNQHPTATPVYVQVGSYFHSEHQTVTLVCLNGFTISTVCTKLLHLCVPKWVLLFSRSAPNYYTFVCSSGFTISTDSTKLLHLSVFKWVYYFQLRISFINIGHIIK